MSLYQVKVPNGVVPGSQFQVRINGKLHTATCPPNIYPGQTIKLRINTSTSNENSNSGDSKPTQSSIYPGSGSMPVPPSVSPESVFAEVTALSQNNSLSVNSFQLCLDKLGYQRFQFSTVKLLFTMFDQDHSNSISKDEFLNLMNYVNKWKDCFVAYDKDKSGTIDLKEMKTAITTFGYRFSDQFFQKLFQTFDADNSGSISFDEFMQLFGELHLLTEEFKKKDHLREGKAEFQYEEFLSACFSIHT